MTHVWSPAIAAHFERLKREAAPFVDVYLVANLPPGTPPEAIPADLFVTREECADVLPGRYQDCIDKPRLEQSGHVDMIWITAFRNEMFARYDRFWLIEFDVDFAGDWGQFFGGLSDEPADLLSGHIYHKEERWAWSWWASLVRPDWVTSTPVRAFMPISRYSRKLVDKIVEAYAGPGWHGHFEALIPCIADAYGFAISDIGGNGPFAPAERHNRFYRDVVSRGEHEPSSYRFRPQHSEVYFVQDPAAFPVPGLIYHPVKRIVAAPKRKRKPRPLATRVLGLLADPRRIPAAISRRVRSKR